MLQKLKENWELIKTNLRDEFDITNVSYKIWIEPLDIYDMQDNTLRVIFTGGNEDFAINYITRRYTHLFRAMIEETTGIDCDVSFIHEPESAPGTIFKSKEIVSVDPVSIAIQNAKLNPKYTFDTFVVGANNKFAHAASLSVAESPGKEYNPLFIYGGPGLGKTHLMHSIANFIITNNPNIRILYVTSESFTNEIIENLRYNKNNMAEIRNKYRNIDVLLIDDIQFIIGKEATQNEFFNTFNYLYENGKQIVLSSDKPPKNFDTLEERFKSRFEWGLSVDISAPDYETRMAILRRKEEVEGYTIDNEILQYIATNIRTNIRELEGALTKMYAYSKLHPNAPLTLEVAKNNLKDIISPDNEKRLTPEHILEVIAEHYGVTTDDIRSSKRNRDIVLPRQIAMYLIRVLNDISLEDVGRILGGKDHSTVIHGYEKIINEMNNNEELRNSIEIIKKKLSQ